MRSLSPGSPGAGGRPTAALGLGRAAMMREAELSWGKDSGDANEKRTPGQGETPFRGDPRHRAAFGEKWSPGPGAGCRPTAAPGGVWRGTQ